MTGLPDPAVKASVWAELIDPNNKDSAYMRDAKMAGFYSLNQLDIVSPYFDKFFDVLPLIYKQSSYRSFQSFFYNLLPRMVVTDEHIVKLIVLKQETPDNEKNFMTILQDGIELLLRSKQIRELSEEQK